MIEQQGRVVSVTGSMASVLLGANSGCPACDAGKGCGAGIFGRLLIRKPMILELENSLRVAQGQVVVVGIPENLFLSLLLRVYLLPLLAGLLGALLGHYLGEVVESSHLVQDMLALSFALIFAVLTLLRSNSRKMMMAGSTHVSLVRLADIQAGQICEPKGLETDSRL